MAELVEIPVQQVSEYIFVTETVIPSNGATSTSEKLPTM